MEEEPKVSFISKSLVWVKSHIAITVGVAVAVVVIIILLCVLLPGGPKSTVKKFVKGMSSLKVSTIEKTVDFVGSEAWTGYDEEDFSDKDYEDFLEDYKDAKDDFDKDEIKENLEDLQDSFDDIKDEAKKYEIKVEKFKSVEKIAKDLYVVEAKIAMNVVPKDEDEKEVDESKTVTFVVYKNKIIDSSIFGF